MHSTQVKRKTIGVSAPESLIKEFDYILQETYFGRSRSSMITDLIADFVERWKNQEDEDQNEEPEKE